MARLTPRDGLLPPIRPGWSARATSAGGCQFELRCCGHIPVSWCILGLPLRAVRLSARLLNIKPVTSPATIAQSTALFLPTDADTTVFCPTFKNAYGGGALPAQHGHHSSEHVRFSCDGLLDAKVSDDGGYFLVQRFGCRAALQSRFILHPITLAAFRPGMAALLSASVRRPLLQRSR